MARVTPPRTVKKLEKRAAEVVADHEVFTVRKLDYADLPRSVFVFDCPDWCNVIAETPDGQLVLVWQYRFGTDALSLEVPGGVIDPGEAPEDAARRELREETGYEADAFELLSVVEPNPALQGNRCFTFVARGARPSGQTAFDDLEECEVALVPIASIPELIDRRHVTHALVVVALETYWRKKA